MFAGRLGTLVWPQLRYINRNTLRPVLDEIFLEQPLLRSYILNDQGELRRGLWVFINGALAGNKNVLDRLLTLDAAVYLRERPCGGCSCEGI
jgi:hypothetical protein